MKNLLAQVLGLALAVIGLYTFIELERTAFADNSAATATSTLTATPTFASSQTESATLQSPEGITATPTITTTAAATTTESIETPGLTVTLEASSTETVAPTAELGTETPTPTPGPTATPTPKPYALSLSPDVLSIAALSARSYGRGTIRITHLLSDGQFYRQALIEYDSDGLRITGTMNIPHGNGPFPVIIMDHGYFKPAEYKTGDGTAPASNVFAQNGYLTIASDYRCYAGSQCGPDPFYIGYAIDVLNLIAELPSFSLADTTRVGIWGHSMGGGITIRVITINHSIKVASLYGALSSDDEVHYCWLYGCTTPLVTPVSRTSDRFLEFDPEYFRGMETPVSQSAISTTDYKSKLHQIFLQSSPSHFLGSIDTPVIIHHGEADETVPIQWSVDLADQLNALGKTATLYTYPGQGHVFTGFGWQLFMTRTLDFFNSYLNPRATPITVDRRVLVQERAALADSY